MSAPLYRPFAPAVASRFFTTLGASPTNDGAAAERRLERDQPFELVAHICVVSMRLVDNQDLLGETGKAERLELPGKHGEQRLVDRADAQFGEQRLAGSRIEPFRRRDRAIFPRRPAQRSLRLVVCRRARFRTTLGAGRRGRAPA